jgi:hypothetical protein
LVEDVLVHPLFVDGAYLSSRSFGASVYPSYELVRKSIRRDD